MRLGNLGFATLFRAAAVFFWALCALLRPYEARAFEPARLAVDMERPVSGFSIFDAFPGITFNEPLCIASPPGETNRLFVVERAGVIVVITNLAEPNRSVFLDLSKNTAADYVESGMLGLAFHPNFKTNGQFFVVRSVFVPRLTQRLSRFTVSPGNPNAASTEETILIDQADASPAHNGGDIHFGADGYLYYSVGDEGPTLEDQRSTHQAIDGGLFGGIFRIDVDQRPGSLAPNAHPSVRGNYSIPADNPFVGATSYLEAPVDPKKVRTEFFATGFRNPWRFCVDAISGEIFVGDVGGDWEEEVNLLVKGGNYGWPYVEGGRPLDPPAPDWLKLEPPLWSVTHGRDVDKGSCIIGGVVCRNMSIPSLEGWYVFGDERSGNIRKLKRGDSVEVEWIAREPGISAFGRNPATGDLLMASFTQGQIRKLVFVDPAEQHIPTRLSATGIFSDLVTLKPAPGLLPYEINVSFWSDHATKRRWFGLSDPTSKVTFSPTNNWTFPNGAVWVKHFDLEMERGNPSTARRVETRLLFKSMNEFHGFTYRWDGRDAVLVPAEGAERTFEIKDPDGQVRTQRWVFPPRGDCIGCHTKVGGGAIGFNTAQLNLETTVGGVSENQLAGLADAGYLQAAATIKPQELPALAKSTDTTAPLEYRVKSYLAANCAQCHQPGGTWAASWSARLTTPMSEANLINAVSVAGLSSDARVIAPHSLTNSMMYWRIAQETARMPPIGSTVLDESARKLLAEWIGAMPDSSFSEAEVGSGPLSGSITQQGDVRAVSGIGMGMSAPGEDHFHFLYAPLQGNGHVVGRLRRVPGPTANMKAGLLIRESQFVDSTGAWLARGNSGNNALIARPNEWNEPARVISASPRADRPWMRLVRAGNRISAWESADAMIWDKVGETDFVSAGEGIVAGIGVASGENWRFATAEFDQVQTLSVGLEFRDPAPGTPLPRELLLEANVQTNGSSIDRVDIFADGELLTSMSAAPWRFNWTNAWAGDYALVATAIDQNGLSVTSQPVAVKLTAAPPAAKFLQTSAVAEDWRGNFGRAGMVFPGIVTNLPARAILQANGDVRMYPMPGILPDLAGVSPATVWRSDGDLILEYQPGSEIAYRLTLLMAPYESTNAVTLTVLNLLTSATLDSQTVLETAGGRFISWIVHGPIRLQIHSNGETAATVAGVFWDASTPPTVRLLPFPVFVQLPASILMQAEATADFQISRVELWDGGVKLQTDIQRPFLFQWAASEGKHVFTAVAIDEYGGTSRSEAIEMVCNLPQAAVSFINEDRQTRGDWIGAYGSVGRLILAGSTNLPPTIDVNVQGIPYGLAGFETNRSTLRSLETEERIAACYYVDPKDTLELRVTARDGEAVRLSLYFVDWLGPGRSQEVKFVDASSGAELDRRIVSQFAEGAYLTWNIRGDVRVLMRSLNDFNTVVSGIFFDRPAPEMRFTIDPAATNITLPATILLRAEPLIDGKSLHHVEFISDRERISSVTNAPYEAVWTNALAGRHSLFARAAGYSGAVLRSASIWVNLDLPAARATFVGQSGSIKGNWWKTFGADGFKIPFGPDQQRPFTRITPGSDFDLHELVRPGSDERGVFLPDEKLFAAACWSSLDSLNTDVEFLDGREHLIAFYFVDFERVAAAQLIQVVDGDSGAILDERPLDDIGEGIYLAWKIQGHVRFQITRLSDSPAMFSGIFIGGPIVDSQFWWAKYFGGDLLATPKWNGDPDQDGRPNYVEYAVGSDPLVADAPLQIKASLEGELLMLDLDALPPGDDVTMGVEASADLVHWTPVSLIRADTMDDARFATPIAETARFYRLRFDPLSSQ